MPKTNAGAHQTLQNGAADFTVGWNLWWGDNGSHWTLYQNGEPIHSASLTPDSPSAQSGAHRVSVTEAGTYTCQVSLCLEDICTDPEPRVLTVTASGDDGGDNGDNGDWNPWADLDLGSPEDAKGFVTLMREALDELSNETGRTYELAAAIILDSH